MCLVLIAYRAHGRYPLVIAANRDEAYARPAVPAHFWNDCPDIHAGRDLDQGGTWLGLARSGRFAAVTNFRRGVPRTRALRSRGELVSDYLKCIEDTPVYLRRVKANGAQYNGFSLLAGDMDALYFFSNHGDGVQRVDPGVHGLSNHLLDEPWPKVIRGSAELRSMLDADEERLAARLFELLADRTPAPDDQLPSTGVGLQRERELSASFIAHAQYGTRASTVIIVHSNGEVLYRERSFGPFGSPLGTVTSRFALELKA